jgi:hypothetical protein
MGFPELDRGQSLNGSNADLWRLIRRRAHQLATLRRDPTDHELDEFTRLVERLPAPAALRPSR